jgi:phage shock protein PspC (stress-responsive transcriptional regulator)
MVKKLYRSKTNRMVAGVLGGLGNYLNVDPTVLRLAYVFLMFLTMFFPLVIVYILAAIIIPEEGE